jgi:hypothetical protein
MNQMLFKRLRQRMEQLRIARLALALAASVGVVNFAVADRWEDSRKVEGTWHAIETCCDGGATEYQYSITFGAGADEDNGIVVHSDSGLAGTCMNTQGVWERVSERTFIATYEGYCSNASTTPATHYTIKFNASVTLDKSGKKFEGTENIYIINAANVVTAGPLVGTLQGVRMEAKAPKD